jgi:hypothetical protein
MVATTTSAKTRSRLTIRATDVTGQRIVRLRDVGEETIAELMDRILPAMGLPAVVGGRDVSYSLRLEREGRHLHASEDAHSVLKNEDEVLVSPNIDAG